MAVFASAATPLHATKEENLDEMLRFIDDAAKKNADFILFPELALGVPKGGMNLISPEDAHGEWEKSELIPQGNTVSRIIEKAKEHNIYVCWSMGERDPYRFDVLYNTAVLVGPEGFVGKYSKSHTVLSEKFVYYAGNEYSVFDTKLGRIGAMICYDLNFPEVARILMLKGAQIIVCPTAWGCAAQVENDGGDFHRYNIMCQARALENMVPVIATSFAGYWFPDDISLGTAVGHATIVNAGGVVIAQTGWEPGIAIAELDIVRDTLEARYDSMHMGNMVRDRRPDLYGEITRIHKHCMMVGGMTD